MSEFLRYVLWELQSSLGLVVLAGIAAASGLLLYRFQYERKYRGERKFPWGKSILCMVFIGYLAVVVYATLLRHFGGYRQVNLHLFRAWREAWNNFSVKNWANVLLNIAMFVPLGFLLPLLSKGFRKWYVTIPSGFAVSSLIELIQLAAMRGICDVDDLFCNGLGCAMGYFAVMVLLSTKNGKGKRWKPLLGYFCLTLISLGAVGSVFLVYHAKEFGNLPQAAAYRINTRDTVWELECALPEVGETAAVYQTQTRSKADCDAFAEDFKRIISTEFDDISYYQEAAYYMDHGNGDGAHFLFVHYLDQGYEYTAIYDDEPVWADADRETVLKALEKYPLLIPEAAEFMVEGDGWHSFNVSRAVDDGLLLDGILRVRIAGDSSVREIENGLLSYTYYRHVAVISPEEAYRRLCAGKFQDGDFFEMKNPEKLSVLACAMEYRVDTKGFYQPVYVFDVQSPDGDYQCRLLIPALK